MKFAPICEIERTNSVISVIYFQNLANLGFVSQNHIK